MQQNDLHLSNYGSSINNLYQHWQRSLPTKIKSDNTKKEKISPEFVVNWNNESNSDHLTKFLTKNRAGIYKGKSHNRNSITKIEHRNDTNDKDNISQLNTVEERWFNN